MVTLSIPPLRERAEDIPLLFSHFVAKASARFGRQSPDIPAGLTADLKTRSWPGNVRELHHFAERFVLGLEPGQPVTVATPPQGTLSLPERLERYEAEQLRQALADHDGDVRRTIEALGIPRKTFYDKLARHGINRADYA